MPFIPDSVDNNRGKAFCRALELLIKRLTVVNDESSSDISNEILKKACRTSAGARFNGFVNIMTIIMFSFLLIQIGADSYFMISKMFCVEGTVIAQRSDPNDPPIFVHIFRNFDR